MNDEDALLAAMRERPHDHTPRLVLADWYDDHNMPHEALYHRGVVASRQAAEATDRVGDYIHGTTANPGRYRAPELSGTTHRGKFRAAEHTSDQARIALADDPDIDPENVSRGIGRPRSAGRNHMNAAADHRDAAWHARQAGDNTLSELHRDAAAAHDKAWDVLRKSNAVDRSDEYYHRDTGAKVMIAGFTATHNPTGGRVQLSTRFIPTDPQTGDPTGPVTGLHPAEFHNTYERA